MVVINFSFQNLIFTEEEEKVESTNISFLEAGPLCWNFDVHAMATSIVQLCQSHEVVHLAQQQINSSPSQNNSTK